MHVRFDSLISWVALLICGLALFNTVSSTEHEYDYVVDFRGRAVGLYHKGDKINGELAITRDQETRQNILVFVACRMGGQDQTITRILVVEENQQEICKLQRNCNFLLANWNNISTENDVYESVTDVHQQFQACSSEPLPGRRNPGATITVADNSPKVYWTTSGLFGPFNIRGLIPTYPDDRDIMIPINMWIIDHPSGLIVYDTGNSVSVSDGACKTHWLEGLCDFLQPSQSRGDVIDKQLEKVGFAVDDVKIVITSHSHLDHIGNIEMFPDAIHVIQKKELYQAWWPEKFQRGGAHVMADYDDARDFTYFELNGDYDLFGDGTVTIISTPGHTLGHQSVKVRMRETGTVILTQDAIWMEENLEGFPAGLNYSILDYNNSVNRLKMMRDMENAPLWLGHSIRQYEMMGEKWYQ